MTIIFFLLAWIFAAVFLHIGVRRLVPPSASLVSVIALCIGSAALWAPGLLAGHGILPLPAGLAVVLLLPHVFEGANERIMLLGNGISWVVIASLLFVIECFRRRQKPRH